MCFGSRKYIIQNDLDRCTFLTTSLPLQLPTMESRYMNIGHLAIAYFVLIFIIYISSYISIHYISLQFFQAFGEHKILNSLI